MREAIGGAFTLEVLVAIILILNGYLAYSVNYTRAFRTKNEIINIIENYEGVPFFTSANASSGESVKKIDDTLKRFGYNYSYANALSRANVCQSKLHGIGYGSGICIIPKAGPSSNSYYTVSYEVRTYVNINIPIFNKFFDGALPEGIPVSGETNTIYVHNNRLDICIDQPSDGTGRCVTVRDRKKGNY